MDCTCNRYQIIDIREICHVILRIDEANLYIVSARAGDAFICIYRTLLDAESIYDAHNVS